MVSVQRDQDSPLEVLWLDNGLLQLGLVPDLGGRLLSLRFGGQELLWRNDDLLDARLRPRAGHRPAPHGGRMGDWLNYGGDKTWPAPQGWAGDGQWAGPPDPVLDSGRYNAVVEQTASSAAVTMTSDADPVTGLILTRRFELHPGRSSYRLELSATNAGNGPVRWALWNITQHPGGEPGSGAVIAALAGQRRPPVVELVAGTGNPAWHAAPGGRVVIPHQDVVGKLGLPDSAGWLAHVTPTVTLTQSFQVFEDAEYPDLGSRLEVWLEHPLPEPLSELGDLDPPARIVECEVLGPLTILEPGETTRLVIDVGVSAGSADVFAVTPVGHWIEAGSFAAYRTGLLTFGQTEIELTAGEAHELEVPAGVPMEFVETGGIEGIPVEAPVQL